MKYYIVGKKTKEGNLESDSESGKLDEYFELGWEYAVSHLHIKHLFSTGKLQNDDVIVTLRDRMFMYQGFWNNVIAYEDFSNQDINSEIVDLCNLIQKNQVSYLPKLNSKNIYEHWEGDKEVIKNIKYKDISHLKTNEDYCCLHIRYRKWASYRNLSKEFWNDVIKKIEKSGLNIFVFGKEAVEFANNKNIFHVNFDEYASLLNNSNCKYLIGNMSGGTLVGQLFSNENCKNYVIIADEKTEKEFNTDNAYKVFYHKKPFNFSKAPINHVFLTKEGELEKFMNEDSFENIHEYIILGGGVTGVAAARRLQQKEINNFILLEGEDEPGGLCRTKFVDGHYFDIGGGHVLHSKYQEVLDWIFEHISIDEFNKFDTKVLIDLEGHPIEFPIELNLWQLPTEMQVEYLHSYISAASNDDVDYENFEDWIRNYLGDKIADNYMIPYNKKLWCLDISTLNTDWLSKIPKTDIKLILKTIIEKKSHFTEEVVSHKSFYYPKEGGFQTIFDSIYKHIESHVELGVKVKNLKYDKENKLWIIDGKYKTKKIICTIPWTLLDIEIDGFDYKKEFENLDYLSDVISLWEREPYSHNAHWKYIPNPNVEQHREFYIHNFAPHSKPGGVMTDINRKRWVENGKKWKAGTPLYEHENIYSYPLPTKVYKEAMKNILNFSKDYNLYGLGRWGQWQYFNTDQCIKQVLDFFENEDDFNYFKIF